MDGADECTDDTFTMLLKRGQVAKVQSLLDSRSTSEGPTRDLAARIVEALKPSATAAAASAAVPSTSAGATRILSYDAMARARTTLSDFTAFYLPLHELTDRDFFRWLPLLVYVEAMVYQADEDNEARAASFARAASGSVGEQPAAKAQAATLGCLVSLLESRGLMSDRVRAELENGRRYWAEERRLCAGMVGAGGAGGAPPPTFDEVLAASALKSFDYRLLHALLCALSGREASAALLRFLNVDETLTDIADDLFDYEKDVARNSFNVLRGAAHALGEAAPLALATRIGEMEREHEAALCALPEPTAAAYRSSRRAAMRRPGSEKWIFPRLMLPAQEMLHRAAEAERRAAGGAAESDVESDNEPADRPPRPARDHRKRPRPAVAVAGVDAEETAA